MKIKSFEQNLAYLVKCIGIKWERYFGCIKWLMKDTKALSNIPDLICLNILFLFTKRKTDIKKGKSDSTQIMIKRTKKKKKKHTRNQ